MERLKLIIADKILEVSSGTTEQMNERFRKIQRFTDFAEACKSLMTVYPEVEPALIRMVEEYDFDTAKASRIVDSIINRHNNPDLHRQEENRLAEKEICLVEPELPHSDDESGNEQTTSDSDMIEQQEPANPMPEESLPEESLPEELLPEELLPEEENILYSAATQYDTIEQGESEKRRKTNTLILQIIMGAILLFVTYLIFKFVVNYWKYILLVLFLSAAAYGGWLYYKKRKKRQ